MGATRKSALPAGGPGKSRLIVGLMLLLIVVVAGMAWQAQQAVEAHGKTAVNVLRDYAALASEEYSRRAMAATGYYGYYLLTNELRTSDGNLSLPQESPASYVFRIARTDRRVEFTGNASSADALRRNILESFASLTADSLPEPGYVVSHIVMGGKQHSFVVTVPENADAVLGFEVDRGWLMSALETAYSENTLLPETLAGGAVTNDLLAVRMYDGSGEILFQSDGEMFAGTRYDRTFAEEYNGIFRDHALSVSIDPALAEQLIIGGLPPSRLPLFIAVLLLAGGLLLAAIRQLQRESALIEARSHFVAEVSHELRTPLAQIRMFAETLLLGRLPPGEEQDRALSVINRESQRLIHMVENILRFSAARRGTADVSPELQPLAPVIRSVVEEFGPMADTVSIATDLDETVQARVAADGLRQVLVNLLDNALKYGPHGQTVQVSLQARQGQAVLSVSDSGPGIPATERDRVWTDYYRLERERASAIAGTGIGLAVVRDIVRAHAGKVSVTQSDGGGACFIVELPL